MAAAAVVCHAPAVLCGWIWDDDFYVWNNPVLRSPGGLLDIWFRPLSIPQYYPLVHTSFWIEHRLWGDHPAGYHAVNVLLHAAAAALLWHVLRRLDVPAAWLGATLFAVHPVGVETVAWVTERKNTLSLCLALGSLAAWLEFRDRDAAARAAGDSAAAASAAAGWRWYVIALVLFAAALLSKTVTVSLAGVILVIGWWKTGSITPRDLRLAAPWIAVGLPLALATVWIEKHHVGAGGVDWGLSPADRIVLAGRIVCFYAAKLVWPHPLAFFYDRWRIDAREAWQWFFPAAVAAAAAAAWLLRGRIGRGPLAAVLLFVGCLFPALGFFDVYPFKFSFVADHFQYHAAAAGLAAAAAAGMGAAERLGRRREAACAAILACATLGAVAFARTRVFAGIEPLFIDTLAKTPGSWAARNILSPHYTDIGRYADADRVYSDARGAEDLPPWPHDRAMWHYNHARALEGLGRREEAERLYREAIALDPGYPKPRSNLAKLLADTGRLAESRAEYERLLGLPLSPADRGRAAFNLGTVLAETKAWPAAEARLRESLATAPAAGETWEWLGIAVLRQGRVAEAAGHFERAVALAATPAAAARARGNLAAARELERSR